VTRRATGQDLNTWAEMLSGIARTGLGFTESLYEQERYEEIIKVAAEIQSHAKVDPDMDNIATEMMKGVGKGVPGYVTPKVAIGAVVGNDEGEILLVQRSDSGIWLYPTGWADVGYSATEVAVKEVHEETGIRCEPVGLMAILDGMRMGFTQIPLYSLVFHCRAIGGELQGHPLETSDVGWFSRDNLPTPLANLDSWVEPAFAAIDGKPGEVSFDMPRSLPWE
jgi:ADP-ribose pyrophosphatase YjhB (NUDIX family)